MEETIRIQIKNGSVVKTTTSDAAEITGWRRKMMNSIQLKRIEDRTYGNQRRPRVNVFIDLDSLLCDVEGFLGSSDAIPDDDTLAAAVEKIASSVGKFSDGTVYFSDDIVKNDGLDHPAWRAKGFNSTFTPESGFTKDDINLDLMFDAHTKAVHGMLDVAVLVVGKTNYTALAKRLLQHNVTVVMISNYHHSVRTLPKDSCVYISTRSVFDEHGAPRENVTHYTVAAEDQFDEESFDYTKFIRLLATSEELMPFVGVNYFVTRVMWRLGDAFREQYACQRLFQSAKDRGFVEIYERANLHSSDNPVSACKLNQENDLVKQVILELESIGESSDPQVSVKYTESGPGSYPVLAVSEKNDHLIA